jgi:hypothetical protein
MDRCRPRTERHGTMETPTAIHCERCDGIWETQAWGIEIWTWIPTYCKGEQCPIIANTGSIP